MSLSKIGKLEEYLKGTIPEGKTTLPEVLTPDILKEWISKPSTVRIETINKCNASCPFCGYSVMKRKEKKMSKVLFKKIIDECAEWNPSIVKPYLHGELFCDPDWKQRLKYIDRKLNSSIYLETNAFLLDKDAIDFLLDLQHLKTIGFNVSGGHPSKYEEIMGLEYSIVQDNIIEFLNATKKTTKTLEVFTTMVASPANHTVQDGQFYRRAWGPLSRTNMSFNYGGSIGPRHRLHSDQFCQGLKELCILSNGKVALCWFDLEGEVILGNARKETLLDIWNSTKANEIRLLQRTGKRGEIPLCNRCDFC